MAAFATVLCLSSLQVLFSCRRRRADCPVGYAQGTGTLYSYGTVYDAREP